MKKLFYLFLLTLAGGNIYAQGTSEPKIVRDANTAFESGKYHEAIEKLQAAYDKIGTKGSLKEKGKVRFKLAEAYRQISRYEEANENYDVCIELKYFDVNPDVYFFKGEMLRMMGDYAKAQKSYTEYKKISKGARTKELEIALKACEEYKFYDMMEPEVNYQVKCETKINRKEFDMSPTYADKKGYRVAFSSSREESFGSGRDPITGEKYMDIFVAEFDKNGDPTGVVVLDEDGIVNTSENEGAVCFDKKFKSMFFTRCPSKERMELGCDIWLVDIEEGEFKNPRKMDLKKNEITSVGHPCLSLDGKMLIFASDMDESGGDNSFGGRDLWYVTYDKKSKKWDSIPRNMGPKFNTSGNELFPSIGKTGKFFFASDGHKGIGGLDIFYANPVADEDNKWSDPKNMGYPINSPSNDYAITDRGRNGYFTSERRLTSGQHAPDIWSYAVPPNLFDLKVIVHEFGSPKDRIENAEVTVLSSDETTWSGPTDAKGSTIKWDVKNGRTRYIMDDMEYSINAAKEGYMINKESAKISTVGLGESQSFIVEIELVHIEEELRAPEVRYPLNQWTFINDESCMSKDSLLFLSDLLSSHPYITIDLFSHTDSRSSAKYNQVLSENRAKAVYKFLVEEKGIDPRRIQPIGMGEEDPASWIDENGEEIVLTEKYINKFRSSDKAKFEKLHQINRRTTARITSQEFDSKTAPPANAEWMEFKPLR
jgi:peptidoglycan-associated lipoprotein